jgi:hypothetical protein
VGIWKQSGRLLVWQIVGVGRVSDYTTLRDAIAAKVSGLIGSTLPIDTVVFAGMTPERFMQESCVIAVNVALAEKSGAESEILGSAVFQPQTWLWDVCVMSMTASGHDEGTERAMDAMDAIRDALCPADGWKPDANSDVMMWASDRPVGYTATGAVVWASRYRNWRNMG